MCTSIYYRQDQWRLFEDVDKHVKNEEENEFITLWTHVLLESQHWFPCQRRQHSPFHMDHLSSHRNQHLLLQRFSTWSTCHTRTHNQWSVCFIEELKLLLSPRRWSLHRFYPQTTYGWQYFAENLTWPYYHSECKTNSRWHLLNVWWYRLNTVLHDTEQNDKPPSCRNV